MSSGSQALWRDFLQRQRASLGAACFTTVNYSKLRRDQEKVNG